VCPEQSQFLLHGGLLGTIFKKQNENQHFKKEKREG
jgi:hypothetical protein